jgi:hypothetical protein
LHFGSPGTECELCGQRSHRFEQVLNFFAEPFVIGFEAFEFGARRIRHYATAQISRIRSVRIQEIVVASVNISTAFDSGLDRFAGPLDVELCYLRDRAAGAWPRVTG